MEFLIMILFHGSTSIIEQPIYRGGKPDNDYGYGFYCTRELDIAKEWANRNSNSGIVNKYSIDLRYLKILDLTKESFLVWISTLLKYRSLSATEKTRHVRELEYLKQFAVDVEEYDVVIAYRADDAYFRFPMMFLNSDLTIETTEKIYMLGDLGIQYVLISEKAISKIKYISSEDVESIYHDKYLERMDKARSRFEELYLQEHYNTGKRLIDLVRDDD